MKPGHIIPWLGSLSRLLFLPHLQGNNEALSLLAVAATAAAIYVNQDICHAGAAVAVASRAPSPSPPERKNERLLMLPPPQMPPKRDAYLLHTRTVLLLKEKI